jgi:hypothetical protein
MTVEDRERIVQRLQTAALLGFSAWSAELSAHLADDVEIVHTPPVPELDGRRSRADAATYLHEETIAFPRAFHDDFAIDATVAGAPSGVRADFIYKGTLRNAERSYVTVGFELGILLVAGRIVRLTGSPLPDTSRAALISWLKAVDANGGFHPPAPSPA